jgi:hypothetical protein
MGGDDWDGSVADISSIRCDGLVEYSYEKNGIKVCTGYIDPLWDISVPDTVNPENHNIFHGGPTCANRYKKGDICPRIQAGDVGQDTTFYQIGSEKPTITGIQVERKNGDTIQISFKPFANVSEYVYVRILVRRFDQNDFWFVCDEEGTWCLRQVLVNRWTNQPVVVNWKGTTADKPELILNPGIAQQIAPAIPGPDYRDLQGNYEFRIQCIDEGGNVSDEYSYIDVLSVRQYMIRVGADPMMGLRHLLVENSTESVKDLLLNH